MNFTEQPFLFLLLITYGLWLLCRGHYHARLVVLLAASLVFYAYHAWYLVFLILAYCLVDWAVGLWIARSRRPGWPLAVGVVFNLAGLVTVLAAINVGAYEFTVAALGKHVGYDSEKLRLWKVPAQTAFVLALTASQALINHRGIRLTTRPVCFCC